MTERTIGEVFTDTEHFAEPKRIKCVDDIKCVECVYHKIDCDNIPCRFLEREDENYVYFIETNEPLTEQP